MAEGQLTGRDRRTSERMTDDSILLVSGYSDRGAPFAMVTSINDISLGGISFFLDEPVCKDMMIHLALCSKRIDGLIFCVKAIPMRIIPTECDPARYMIGARFQGEFLQIGSSPQIEDIARELQEAVKNDERARLNGVRTMERCCEICGKTFVVPPEILRVATPVCCFSCHQSRLEFESPAEEPVGKKWL